MTDKKDKKVICHDIQGKEYAVAPGELVFRPSVYGLVIEEGKILLSKQWDGYDFPGGGVEIAETVEEALKREVWEETGIEVSVGEVIHCESSFFKSRHSGKCFHAVLVYFLCRRIGGELSKDNFDEYEKEYADMPEWVGLDKIDRIKFYNSVDSHKIIRKALTLKDENE